MIRLRHEQLEKIRRHAEREYPHECCGLLVGHIADGGRTRVIAETYPVANEFDGATLSQLFGGGAGAQSEGAGAQHEQRHHRMLIPPQAYLRAERLYAARGLGVVGNYHSHPEHPAVPSQFDLAHLAPWPTMSYIVVSVRQGKATDLRSWELAADRSQFDEEEIAEGD